MRNRVVFEGLEGRQLLSFNPAGMVPAQVRHAYGFDQVAFAHRGRMIAGDGRGQTIAIVTAYDAPTIENDINVFSRKCGLPTTDAYGKPTLTKVIHRSQPSADSGWALEASLDVEWAHAIAPKAHILLVEAASSSTTDLLTAVNYARSQNGVVAVSMSLGGHETPVDVYNDDYLSTPAGATCGIRLSGPGKLSFAVGEQMP